MYQVVATAKLKSTSPFSYNSYIESEKAPREPHDKFEERTWKERCHADPDGNLLITQMMLKNCIADSAQFSSRTIKGKGKATYTKHFQAGLMVTQPIVLPINIDDVEHEWVYVPSDGKKGGGTKVKKCFPIVPEWEGEAIYLIFDEVITEDVFKWHLDQAGQLIGMGRWRPRNNGLYGRFRVESVKWEVISTD